MRKWASLLVVVLGAVCGLVDLTHEFFANSTLQYYSSEPRRLFDVAGIAIGVGLAALAFSRLLRRAQRRVELFAWGAGATIATGFFGCAFFLFHSLPPVILANSGAGGLLLPLLFAAVAAHFWFEFFRVWRTRITDPS